MTTTLTIKLEGDNAWPDLQTRREDIIHLGDGSHIEVAGLSGGMASGLPSVILRIDLPPQEGEAPESRGKVVLVETSMRNFLMAARVLLVRYGLEMGEPGEEG